MITAAEAAYGLYGAARLARYDPAGLSCFGNSAPETLRSFYAALVAAPLYAILLALQIGEADFAAPLPKIVLAEIVSFVVGWVAFPLVILQIAEMIGRGDRAHRFIAAYNWCMVLQVAALTTVALVFATRILPGGVAMVVWLAVIIAILAYQWFVARVGLELSATGAVGIVAVDFVISLTLNAITVRMLQ